MLRSRYGKYLTVMSLLLPGTVRAQNPAPNPLPPSTITQHSLENGVRVIIRKDASAPLGVVDLWIAAGAVDDGETGAAHALEHMVFEGSEGVPTGRVDAQVESVGGSVFAATLPDATHYWTAVPPAGVEVAIRALSDLMRPALLDPATWERERKVMLEEIERSAGDTSLTVRRALMRSLYPDAWGAPVAGTPEAIRTLKLETIREFQKRTYVPERMVLVVTGPVDSDKALVAARRTFGMLSRNGPGVPPKAPSPRKGPVRTYAYSGNSVTVGVAWPVPKRGDPAMDLVASVLKQRLLRSVSGMATSIEIAHPWQRASMLAVMVQGPKEQRARLEEIIEQNARSLENITTAELASAARDTAWTWWLEREKPTDQARTLGLAALHNELELITEYPAILSSIHVSDVRTAAGTVFAAPVTAPKPEHAATAPSKPTPGQSPR